MRDQSGFTLIEMLIVIALLGILMVIASPGFQFLRKHRLDSASRELYSDLQRLRQDAITRSTRTKPDPVAPPPATIPAISRGFGIRFDSVSSYQLFEFDDCDGDFRYDDPGACPGPPANPSTREEIGNVVRRLPSDVTVSQVAGPLPLDWILMYDRHGHPRNADWNPVANQTLAIRLPGVNPARCIVISPTRIREGSLNGNTCTAF